MSILCKPLYINIFNNIEIFFKSTVKFPIKFSYFKGVLGYYNTASNPIQQFCTWSYGFNSSLVLRQSSGLLARE